MSVSSSLHRRRKARNAVMMTLCMGAAGIGLAWLALILGALVYKGTAGLSLAVFTEMTPPPGEGGPRGDSVREERIDHGAARALVGRRRHRVGRRRESA